MQTLFGKAICGLFKKKKKRSNVISLEHDYAVNTLLNIPNTNLVITGDDAGNVAVWHSKSGFNISKFELNGEPIRGFALLPKQNHVVVISDNVIDIIDYKVGKLISSITENHPINCVNVIDGMIVTGSQDGKLRFTDAETGKIVKMFVGHTGAINAIAILDEHHIVTGSADNTIRIWDKETGENEIFAGHEGVVNSLVVQDHLIVSGSDDGMIGIWNPYNKTDIKVLQHGSAVKSVAIFNGTIISGGVDGTVTSWDLKTKQPVKVFDNHIGAINQMIVKGNSLVTASNDKTIRVWPEQFFTENANVLTVAAKPVFV